MKQILLSVATFLFTIITLAQYPNNNPKGDSTAANGKGLFPGNNHNSYQTYGANNDAQYGYQQDERANHKPGNYTFLAELRKIKMQPNSYAKRVAAKQLVNNCTLPASQIAALCNALRGYARLDVAQYAYKRCADPGNYGIVFNGLTLDMGNELSDYINYVNSRCNQNDDEQYYPYAYPAQNDYSPMPAGLFNNALQTIENASFETTNQKPVKQLLVAIWLEQNR